MRYILSILLCGFAGAIAAHVAYVQSNLYILGDSTRRGRHPLFDPLAFDGMGLIWGVLVGAVCAAIWSASSPTKTALVGLGVTLAGVGAVGSLTTYQRYRELPHAPVLAGPALELEFELRLPAGRDPRGPMPVRGALNPASKDGASAKFLEKEVRVSDGRTILPGTVPLRRAESSRLISVENPEGVYENFSLPLAEVPTEADGAWTDWMDAVNADRGLPPEKGYQIRYRVRRVSER